MKPSIKYADRSYHWIQRGGKQAWVEGEERGRRCIKSLILYLWGAWKV